MLFKTLKDRFSITFIKNPCKNCLIKPMCAVYCDKRKNINESIYPQESLLSFRIINIFLLLLLFVILPIEIIGVVHILEKIF